MGVPDFGSKSSFNHNVIMSPDIARVSKKIPHKVKKMWATRAR